MRLNALHTYLSCTVANLSGASNRFASGAPPVSLSRSTAAVVCQVSIPRQWQEPPSNSKSKTLTNSPRSWRRRRRSRSRKISHAVTSASFWPVDRTRLRRWMCLFKACWTSSPASVLPWRPMSTLSAPISGACKLSYIFIPSRPYSTCRR